MLTARRNSLISIHAPRGGSDAVAVFPAALTAISIHAPRGGSDLDYRASIRRAESFQSTLPVGGATGLLRWNALPYIFQSTLPGGGATIYVRMERSYPEISIHAPRGGSDFNVTTASTVQAKFQSTLPVGGATICPCDICPPVEISIHAPRGGSDVLLFCA